MIIDIEYDGRNPYSSMTDTLWGMTEHFNKQENWGDPYKVCIKLIVLMDELRKHVGRAIHVNNAYETSGHSDGSQHYIGRAADITVTGMDCWDFMWCAMMLPFSCVIAYPHWNTPGIHVDVRKLGYGKSQKLMWRDNRGKYWNIETLDEFLHLMRIYKYEDE